MVQEYATWEDYLYPVPEVLRDNPCAPRVLRNIPGFTDPARLAAFEYDVSALRAVQIAVGDIEIPRTFDADHLAAIHRALFDKVYEWAGQWRSVDMAKHRPMATWADRWTPELEQFAPPQTIDAALAFAADEIRAVPWEILDKAGVAQGLSQTHAQLTYIHPFREGNGRATRIFLEHVAADAGYALGPYPGRDEYLAAVINANRGNLTPLAELFAASMTELHTSPPSPQRTHKTPSLSAELAVPPRAAYYGPGLA